MKVIEPLSLFESIVFPANKLVYKDNMPHAEFPLDFCSEEDDVVSIPLYLTEKEAGNRAALDVLFAASIDRNIVVYDNDANGISTKLLSIMTQVYEANISTYFKSKVGKFIIDSKYCDELEDLLLKEGLHNEYKDKVFGCEFDDAFKDWLVTDMCMSYVPNKSCLILAIGNKNDVFVCPESEDGKFGLAVLSNKEVLLGNF